MRGIWWFTSSGGLKRSHNQQRDISWVSALSGSKLSYGQWCVLLMHSGLNQLSDLDTGRIFFPLIILSGTFDLCSLTSVMWCMVHF